MRFLAAAVKFQYDRQAPITSCLSYLFSDQLFRCGGFDDLPVQTCFFAGLAVGDGHHRVVVDHRHFKLVPYLALIWSWLTSPLSWPCARSGYDIGLVVVAASMMPLIIAWLFSGSGNAARRRSSAPSSRRS